MNMQAFDIILKLLLQQSKRIMPQLAGRTVVNWLPTELLRLQNCCLDLLGRALAGKRGNERYRIQHSDAAVRSALRIGTDR